MDPPRHLIFFGVLGPVTARFLPEIVERAGIGGDITLPPPSRAFARSQDEGNALQIGTLVIAFIAASSFAFDAKPEISVFYRTRASVAEIRTRRLRGVV